MTPPPIDDSFFLYDFSSEFLPALDFGESFGFGSGFIFDGALAAASDSSFYGSYDVESCSMLIEEYVPWFGHCRHRRRTSRANRHYRRDSVLSSTWYVNFLRPGITRDLTHELSSSDRFGEFRSLFCMPLSKVEVLTDILVNRGYIREQRSLDFREEF